ncbi:GNAT family N-acetyltransferase [Pontixanthobacter gangjinensis]|uniref:GNAT family N-acetyltransferase n=1 Tax=Christiangramia aestuarii TaxID=1028746 RepID=A0A7K1LQX8_9FLAO|nr:GNAT family N-acetyltransferase [Christiangramia aestuarii]MUP43215.1 GNAT family N-acetyltransferase [Christiangramia aestuarii]
MVTYKTFETERLLINPTSTEDAGFILELLNSPKYVKFVGDKKLKTSEDAENYIEKRMISQLERLGYSSYTVIRKSDQTKIGCVGLYDREGVDGIDIGYSFLPAFEGKGYAFEAAAGLKKAAKEVFDLKDLKAIVVKENTGSRKLLEKLGFDFREIIHIPNDPNELMLYILKL